MNHRKRIYELTQKMSHYSALRDNLAAELIKQEKHHLQLEDMLNMAGNVIVPPDTVRKGFSRLCQNVRQFFLDRYECKKMYFSVVNSGRI